MATDIKLSGKALCDIIETCHQAGVRELRLGDLQVRFAPEQNGPSPWLGLTPFSALPANEKLIENTELEMTDADRAELDEALHSHMMIDDPLAYEDHLINSRMEELGYNDKDGGE